MSFFGPTCDCEYCVAKLEDLIDALGPLRIRRIRRNPRRLRRHGIHARIDGQRLSFTSYHQYRQFMRDREEYSKPGVYTPTGGIPGTEIMPEPFFGDGKWCQNCSRVRVEKAGSICPKCEEFLGRNAPKPNLNLIQECFDFAWEHTDNKVNLVALRNALGLRAIIKLPFDSLGSETPSSDTGQKESGTSPSSSTGQARSNNYNWPYGGFR
jgi:hypothetical protein